MPAQCQAWRCTRAESFGMAAGAAGAAGAVVTLWHAGSPGDWAAKPVIELSVGSRSVQWLLAPIGYGWSGALTCAADECVLADGQGAHSGSAQLLQLRGGRLVAPPGAAVITDSPTVSVRDLDGDGHLDVIGLVSDYTPNYAQGRLYWSTYRQDAGRFVRTGCARRTAPSAAPPPGLLTGACPSR